MHLEVSLTSVPQPVGLDPTARWLQLRPMQLAEWGRIPPYTLESTERVELRRMGKVWSSLIQVAVSSVANGRNCIVYMAVCTISL